VIPGPRLPEIVNESLATLPATVLREVGQRISGSSARTRWRASVATRSRPVPPRTRTLRWHSPSASSWSCRRSTSTDERGSSARAWASRWARGQHRCG
jgi:hypothetical protein